MAGRFVGWRKMLAENVDRTRLCLGCDTRIKSLVIRKIALESTLQSHNDVAGRRVSARIESCFSPRADCCWPTCWRVLRESEMSPILVVVEHVFRHQPFEMPLIQDDHVVKQVSSATSNPALGNPVLPRTAKGSANGLASDVPHRRNHIGSKSLVLVEEQELVGLFVGLCFL